MERLPRRASAISPVVLSITLLSFVTALSGFTVTASFMRYSGDDYCYSADLIEHGFWGSQVYAYLHETAFGGNRFSLNLVDGMASLAGPHASGLLPGLILVLWIAGMALATYQVFRVLGRTGYSPEIVLGSTMISFFVLYLTPNLDQSFYWRSALLTYLLPMTVNTWLAVLVIAWLRSARSLALGSAIVLFFALIAAGFSETITAPQIGVYALACATAGLAIWRGPEAFRALARRGAWLTGAALAGSLLALVVLALSPANALRQAALPQPPGAIQVIRMSLYNAYIFIRIGLAQHFGILVLAGLTFTGLGYWYSTRQPGTLPSLPTLVITAIACLVAAYGLVVCVVAPSAYAESSYPDLRALVAAWWVLIIAVAGLGWLLSQALARWLMDKPARTLLRTASMAILLCSCALPIIISYQTYARLPRYQRWAAFWDARDAQIRKASQANAGRVEVVAIDHIIQGVSELSSDPNFWYNVCAARYYQVRQIIADLPGWDR